jgi:hypothetical protein
VAEVHGGPCGPGRAAGDGEDEEPGEEEEQDVGGPDPGVHEPLGVLVHVHRRRRLHVVRRPSPSHHRPVRRISGGVLQARRPGRCRCRCGEMDGEVGGVGAVIVVWL